MRSNFVSFIVQLVDQRVIGPVVAQVISQADRTSVRIEPAFDNVVVIIDDIAVDRVVKRQENQLRNLFRLQILWRIRAHAKTIR